MTEPRHAAEELVAFVTAVREGEWQASEVRDVIGQAISNGWKWPKIALAVTRLAFVEDSEPRDLAEATRTPLGVVIAGRRTG